METKIVSKPQVAVLIPTARFGKIENPPYTNSMCTQ